MSSPHPFRFYGAEPSEWEGDVCSYEVRFRAAPSEPERVAIARAFESALSRTDVDARSYPIRWVEDWALFTVENRSRDLHLDHGLFFEDVRGAFLAVHGAAPIEEIVLIELIDRAPEGAATGGAWHRWSVEVQPIPGDAPRWYGGREGLLETLFAAKQARFAASPVVDTAVEAARRDVWDAATRAADAEKHLAMASARVVFETTATQPTLPPFIAGSGREAFRRGPGAYCDTRAPSGAWLYAHRIPGELYELYLGDAKKLDPIEPRLRGLDVRWAYGAEAVFVWDGAAIHEVDLTTRRARPWMTHAAPVEAMAVLDGALVVISGELTAQTLVVYTLTETPSERLRIPAAGKVELDALLGGKVLVVHAGVVWGDQTLVLAYEDGRLHVMGASDERLGLVWEDAGVVYAELADQHATYVEIHNLEDARRAALGRAAEPPLDLATSEHGYARVPGYVIEIVEA